MPPAAHAPASERAGVCRGAHASARPIGGPAGAQAASIAIAITGRSREPRDAFDPPKAAPQARARSSVMEWKQLCGMCVCVCVIKGRAAW